MLDYNKEDLAIYQKINYYIKEEIVVPFEDNLLLFLATHTDSENKKIADYLSALNSNYSIKKCYKFTRYLALGMEQSFHLCEGKLGSLHNGEFPHAWIETKDSVYDVSFIGKWPKELYYQLFQPIVEKDINLESDESYIKYKNNNIEISLQVDFPLLQYINWYGYMRNISLPNPLNISFYPCWNYFPQDLEKVTQLNIARFIREEWNKQKINDIDDIPPELFSLELNQYINTKNFIENKDTLYKELIKFIIYNRDLYEEKKEILYDISLWKKAMDGKYSGSFCALISEIPNIIAKIKEKKGNLKK